MERGRGAVAATAMGADAAKKQRRKAAKAAAENMVRGSLQSAAEAAAAATGTMARVQTATSLRRTAEVVAEGIEESAGEEMAGSSQRAAEEWAAAEGTCAQRRREKIGQRDCRTGSQEKRSPGVSWSQVRRTKSWRGDRRKR